MIYSFSLDTVGLFVGLVLIIAHGAALALPGPTKSFLRSFPRSKFLGTVLTVIAAVWGFWLVNAADLGEFSRMRPILLIGIPVGAFLAWKFVDEFLAVRALGTLALLAAEPLLSAAYMQEPTSRLFLVTLAYVWILAGLFLVGMPYVLRDLIAWITAKNQVYSAAAFGGAAYGILLLTCSLLYWR
jgi:general stress protein CsbA